MTPFLPRQRFNAKTPGRKDKIKTLRLCALASLRWKIAKYMNLQELTLALMKIPSVTGDEAAVTEFLADYLRRSGWRVELQPVAPERANLIATTDAAPQVVFSTHLDTVPPFIAPTLSDTNIYGRGACDAKGIIAAQIYAAERLRAKGETRLGLLFTADEEAGSAGAKVANRHPLASACRYLINGEPTDNKLAVGSKGSVRVSLQTQGRAAHSAYPELGTSAIEILLDVLRDVRAVAWPSDDFFGATTCNIGVIAGGTKTNVIPAEARADLHFRTVTPNAAMQELLAQAVAGRAEIIYLSLTEPVKMLSVEGFTSCVVRFTTDIPHLSNWGTPLLLGPGSIFDAHTDGEKIALDELAQAVGLYEQLARTLLGKVTV